MGGIDIAPGEKIIEEIRPLPLKGTPLYWYCAGATILVGMNLGLRIWVGRPSFARAALDLSVILLLAYSARGYTKKYRQNSRYLLTDKRILLEGQIQEETITSFIRGLRPRSEKVQTASIPYGSITAVRLKKTKFYPVLRITQNLSGQEAGKDTRREYAMIAIPDPEGTMKKMLGFAPWAAASGQGTGKDIKK